MTVTEKCLKQLVLLSFKLIVIRFHSYVYMEFLGNYYFPMHPFILTLIYYSSFLHNSITIDL